MFRVWFECPTTDSITVENVQEWIEKLRKHCKYQKTDQHHFRNVDVFETVFDSLKEQASQEKGRTLLPSYEIAKQIKQNSEAVEATAARRTWEEALKARPPSPQQVTLDNWLNMWGKLCYGAAGLEDFPHWIRCLPDILFDAMDRDSEPGDAQSTIFNIKTFSSSSRRRPDRRARAGQVLCRVPRPEVRRHPDHHQEGSLQPDHERRESP